MFEHHKQPLASRRIYQAHAAIQRAAKGSCYFHWELVCSDTTSRGPAVAGLPAQRVHAVGRDGSDCSTEHDGWKVVGLILCPVRGADILVAAGVMVTPILHRILHHFHLENEDKE